MSRPVHGEPIQGRRQEEDGPRGHPGARKQRSTGVVIYSGLGSFKGWIDYGPPPEHDVRATALKRAACASPRGR